MDNVDFSQDNTIFLCKLTAAHTRKLISVGLLRIKRKLLLTCLRSWIIVQHIGKTMLRFFQQLPQTKLETTHSIRITMNTQAIPMTNVATAFNVANAAVQATVQASNGGVEGAATPKKVLTLADLKLPEVPAIVLRQTWTGAQFAFFADTQDKGNDTLVCYDVSKGPKAGLTVVPHAFYKTTLKLEDDQQIIGVSQKLNKDLGIKTFRKRERLLKEAVLAKDAAGKVAAPDVADLKNQLKEELTNMYHMMMQKIDEAL